MRFQELLNKVNFFHYIKADILMNYSNGRKKMLYLTVVQCNVKISQSCPFRLLLSKKFVLISIDTTLIRNRHCYNL